MTLAGHFASHVLGIAINSHVLVYVIVVFHYETLNYRCLLNSVLIVGLLFHVTVQDE